MVELLLVQILSKKFVILQPRTELRVLERLELMESMRIAEVKVSLAGWQWAEDALNWMNRA